MIVIKLSLKLKTCDKGSISGIAVMREYKSSPRVNPVPNSNQSSLTKNGLLGADRDLFAVLSND